MNKQIPLVFHLCSLSPGQSSWSAHVAIEGDLSCAGLSISIFYQGQKVQNTTLDEWGYSMIELDHLKPPMNLQDTVYFEARTLSPPMQVRSIDFHPPLVYQSILNHLETFKSWPKHLALNGINLQGANLSGADLSGINLSGADLSKAKLWKTNLKDSILKGAILTEADLSYACLEDADLENTKIHQANLTSTKFKNTDIRGMRGLSLGDLMIIADHVYMDERQKKAYQIGLDRQKTEAIPPKVPTNTTDTATPPKTLSSVYSNTLYGKPNHTHHNQVGYYQKPNSGEHHQLNEVDEELPYKPRLPTTVMSTRAKSELAESLMQRAIKYKKYAQNRSLRGGVDFQLLLIPNGIFTMGRDDLDPCMRPRHEVEIDYPFFMGTTPVTQELYAKIMRDVRFKFPGDQRPAESVSWVDAIQFCNRLSSVEGLETAYRISEQGVHWNIESNGYRLPTEAEWEYAANGGIPFKYAGSDDIDEVAWFQENSKENTHNVKQKKPNVWGLYDMSGNVWEWCYDLFKEDAYHERPARGTINPIVDDTEGPRVIKGGSWSYEAEGLEVSYRSRLATHFKTSRIGFRIARSPKIRRK